MATAIIQKHWRWLPVAGKGADFNPSTVVGILGTMLGYEKIPAYWKMGLKDAESIDFKYTTMSLNKVYDIGFKRALQIIIRNGGKVDGDNVTIATQTPKPVRLEQGFTNMQPSQKIKIQQDIVTKEFNFEFSGTGFAISYEAGKNKDKAGEYNPNSDYYLNTAGYIIYINANDPQIKSK